jgi:[NiFe] hydrogenase assembly HybE family chaperone
MTEPAAAADDVDATAVAARLQAAFEHVRRERMAGLPFVNEALRVEVVGLRRWHGLWLCVLVTPWFMNLMLLPGDGTPAAEGVSARWPAVRTGEYAPFSFPAAVMSFLAGREGELGEYLSCSLFSPMFEFADHEAARQTAQACLAALFDPAADGRAAAEPRPEVAPTPVSKRDFLRGRWHRPTADEAGR